MAEVAEMSAKVLILMGSDSDMPAMEPAVKMLKKFKVPFEITVSSAHRSPERTRWLLAEAEQKGVQVIIAAAGGAAHLPGVIAAETTLPVIGIPLDSSPLKGIDSLMAIAQMPPGVPVATMAVGQWGAANAAILAVQILALNDGDLREALIAFKHEMAEGVERKADKLKQSLEP
jgi:phosphoribosylaminoimidazole carboxylase PurE protein